MIPDCQKEWDLRRTNSSCRKTYKQWLNGLQPTTWGSLRYYSMDAMMIWKEKIATHTSCQVVRKPPNSKTVKDLGVTINESLRWSSHITEVSKQASQTSAWVLRTFATRESLPLMTLYKSLVRMDYCCPKKRSVHLKGFREVLQYQEFSHWKTSHTFLQAANF